MPLLASTVMEYVPFAVVVAAVTVRTEDPEVLIEPALKVAESPLTSEIPSRVRLAVPVKLRGISARLKVADFPCFTDSAALSIVNQKSVPTGVRLQAFPTPEEGALKLELESSPVALFQPEKSSLVPFLGSGTVNGVVEFDAFHHVFFDELSVFLKSVQSESFR